MQGLTLNDGVLVAATIAGPVLAVQAQKWLERVTDRRRQKLNVFYTLMATRAVRLAPDHVQALNRIDIEFSSSRVGFAQRQSARDKSVIDAWRVYHDHLGRNTDGYTDDDWKRIGPERENLFVDLLYAMSESLGFSFDKVQIKRGMYYPVDHETREKTQRGIQDYLLKTLSGELPLKMNVIGFPFSQDAIDSQTLLQAAITKSITAEGEIKVVVKQ